MRPTSPDTKALIDRLNGPSGFWETLRASRDEADLLNSIGDSHEPAAIVSILPFALSTKRDVAKAAAVAVHKLALEMTSTQFAWLDYAVREISQYSGSHSYAWHKMSPEQMPLLERFDETSVSLSGMASFHRSGYVRQAAVERLALVPTGAELPFLILRLNDWVSNVRDVAYEAVGARLTPEYAARFIANLALVSRLNEAGRADHQELIRSINELLQSDACRPTLLESLKSNDRFIRRASFRLALNSTREDLPQVVSRALDDRDTIIRLWAAQTVSSDFTGAPLDQLLEVMKRDRFMPVRREALRIDVRRRIEQLPQELRSALLDTHASMREEARYHLRTIAPMDVAAFYRDSLLAGPPTNIYAAICGLGETGIPGDDRLIVSYVSDRAAKIRGAAVRALARLNAKAHVELFLSALTDENSNVSRQALKALAGMVSAATGEKVWTIFVSAPKGHVKRNALSLLQRLPKWDSIYYLLKAMRDSDEAVARMSRIGIQRWLLRFNRTFSPPSGDQIAKVKARLEACSELLDQKTREEILFSIKIS